MELLLEKIKSIINKNKEIDEITGNNFNIFKVCEIETKEVLICRFICQLIDPNGLHNQGDLFLKKFVNNVLCKFVDYDKLNEKDEIKVDKEYRIKDDRRIDLLIESTDYIIPIEVKIFAGDQDTQCNDYLDWASKRGKKYKLFYLTLDGHFPSEASVKYDKTFDKYKNDQEIENELMTKNILCISFKNEIYNWIKDCLLDISLINKKRVVENLMQFLNIIEELCDMGSDNVNKVVKDLLNNKENFNAYISMKQCEQDITSGVLKRIINDLNNWAKENNYHIDDIYKDYEKEIDNFCEWRRIGNNVPGFGITCENNKFKIPLRVCIEIDNEDSLYYGVSITNKEDQNEKVSKLISEELNIGEGKRNSFFAFWDYIRNVKGEISFRKPKEAFAELLDENNYNLLLDDIKFKLEELMKKIS